MRRLTLCLALIVLPALLAEEKAETKGVKATSKDGKASAVFPAKPTEKKAGERLVYLYESKDGKSAMAFNQDAMSKPIDPTDTALVEKLFTGGRENCIRGIKGKLLSKKALKLSAYPGQTFDAEVTGGIYRSRMYLTEKSLIQVIVVGPKEFVDGPEAKKFLDSLKIEE